MDNAQKAIMIGVGLFITIIIISIVLLITNMGTGMAEDARDNLGNMSAALQNTLKSSYDNKTVKGSDVKSLYTQYKDTDDFVLVIEVTDSNGTSKYYSRQKVRISGPSSNVMSYNGTTTDNVDGKSYSSGTIVWSSGFSNNISSSATYKTYLIKQGDTVVGVFCDKQL